jgi:hypothetical protein
MVQLSCARLHWEAFNTWYNSHLPNMLRVPGYLWAQRYAGLEDGTRFTSLYGVRAREDLPSLFHWDGPAVHPIVKSEYAGFLGLRGMSDRIANVYQQISGAPLRDKLLASDRPLSVVTADVDPAYEEEWDRWYTESHVPNLLRVPGYVMAGRFRALDHPAVNRFNSGPKYLALYECESEEAIRRNLRRGEGMHPEARAELDRWLSYGMPKVRNFRWGFYRLISKHFKWDPRQGVV